MQSNANLELKTIAALAGKQTPQRLSSGDVIFRAGDSGANVYGVVSGQVQLQWDDEHAEIIGPGSCFGVGALVDPDHRRYATAVALSDTELLLMNREEFLFAIQELPMFALEMLHDLELRLQHSKQP